MDWRRPWQEGYAQKSLPQPPKRQKTFHGDLGNGVHESRNGWLTSHDQYSIAWICALHIEMAAARAMLDEAHENLPKHGNDTNIYTLGRIEHHNIVIACLPTAQYGLTNAANVLTHLVRTFPSIRLGLMVGIGGGVPSKADIRLGDIVVGTRVMQYDLGKIVGDGQFQRTAIPKIPHQLLGTAVTSLRAKHERDSSLIPSILKEKFKGHSGYGRPSSADCLFFSTYDHVSPTSACDECDHSKLVSRRKRRTDDPLIHYGAIASGNQVMKSGTQRDNIARQLDVICFEMEAAGLMDILPCLPIRGICDYSDSHKNKAWQRYAAAVAAAYARELLSVLPVTETRAKAAYCHNPYRDISSDHRQRLLDSLRFDQMDSRKSTIKTAHSKTCRWFLNHPNYQAWLDPGKLAQHHGFLWISGKPGAGKSTIMKFAYLNMKRKGYREHSITASFFFNARGEYLEKSIIGMYRSLLLQLLEGYPDLQTVLDDPDLASQSKNGCPCLNVLKDLFCEAVSALGQRSFTCFIDALDECDEQQIVDMVQYFEELAEQATDNGVPLRICFSSRHYPYIVIREGIRLTLEHQPGHAEDLANYVASRLRIKDPALVEELLGKAAGVFLWVILVVDILNKEDRRGRLALRKRLAAIPSDLSELFKDILRRDNENMEDLLLCILWILYAKRPLRPTEFYHALWSGLSLKDLTDPEIPDVTVSDAGDSAERCVISSSKGLAEITKSKRPTVQFIHESVRDFLVKDKGLHELWPDLGFDLESPSHERLKQCCNSYMNHTSVRASVSKLLSEAKSNGQAAISKEYPFLEYASQHVLYHADAAADAAPQDEFLSRFPVSSWISIINLFERYRVRLYTPKANLLYILAEKGFSKLIRTRLIEYPCIHILGERYRYPLFAALANGNKGAIATLLDLPSSIYKGVDITEGLTCRKDFIEYEDRTPLSWAAQDGRTNIVELLLRKGTTVNEVDRGGRMPLSRAFEGGHEATAKLLIDYGADINTNDNSGRTPLSWASQSGHEALVRLLIEKGADVNSRDNSGRTPLSWAAKLDHEAIVKLLIEKGADVNARDNSGRTPLSWASEDGHEAISRLLIEKGADVNAYGKYGRTPLSWASKNGHEAISRLLIEKGADVNGDYGWTPLLEASQSGHEAIVRLLIEKGADINASDNSVRAPLSWASENGHEAIARLLIEKGADVNASDNFGWAPLLGASENGHEVIARLLIEKGADVNAHGFFGKPPLLLALEKGHETTAKLLIEKGADVNARDNYGRTPLSWALEKGHEAIARLLIEKGADVNASDNFGGKPLSWALKNGLESILRLLIEEGADVNAHDDSGRTPLSWASQSGHQAIVRLLIEKGADVNARDSSYLTPLLWAIKNGYEAIARLLIEKGAEANNRLELSWAVKNGPRALRQLLPRPQPRG